MAARYPQQEYSLVVERRERVILFYDLKSRKEFYRRVDNAMEGSGVPNEASIRQRHKGYNLQRRAQGKTLGVGRGYDGKSKGDLSGRVIIPEMSAKKRRHGFVRVKILEKMGCNSDWKREVSWENSGIGGPNSQGRCGLRKLYFGESLSRLDAALVGPATRGKKKIKKSKCLKGKAQEKSLQHLSEQLAGSQWKGSTD